MNKVVKDVNEALQGIEDGMTLMVGGLVYVVSLKIQLRNWFVKELKT